MFTLRLAELFMLLLAEGGEGGFTGRIFWYRTGDFDLAEGKTISDPVVLITHAQLQHKRHETVRVFAELFRERGYSTLAMTFSAGISNRQGPYDCAIPHRHRLADQVRDMRAWIAWLKSSQKMITF